MNRKWVLLAAVLLVSPIASQAEDSAISVEQFNKLNGNWQNYAAVGTPLIVEGRFSSFSRNSVRLRKCELLFQANKGVFFAKPTSPDKIVQMSGRLTQRGKKLVFIISKLKELPSDLDTFRSRELQLDRDEAAPWYKLGTEARSRSQFYEDKILADEAEKAIIKGLTIELRKLKPSDAAGLHKLADKSLQLKSEERFQRQLRYQALLADWNDVQKQAREAKAGKIYDPLLKQLQEFLPGAAVPQDKLSAKERELYQKSPRTAYQSADYKKRVQYHRLFYTTVLETKLLGEADPSGRNGNEIALKIDEQLPERKDLAEKYRLKELDYKFDRVANFTKAEMLTLVRELENRKQQKRAEQAQIIWLKALEERLKPDGVAGLIQIAEEYRKLRNDKTKAAELLIKAYQQEPESEQIAQLLNQIGYKLYQGKWIAAIKMKNLPVDKMAQAMRQGRVTVGMSPIQVRKMLGQPTQLNRLATRNEISEVWVYGQPGGNRMAIQFTRRKFESDAKATVVRISDLSE